MNLPEQTIYELRALQRSRDGEGSYSSIEEKDEVENRLIYSIMQVVITKLLLCLDSQNSHQ